MIEIYVKNQGWVSYDMTSSSSLDVIEVIDDNVQKYNSEIGIKPIDPSIVYTNDFNKNNNTNEEVTKDYTFVYYIICGIIVVLLHKMYDYYYRYINEYYKSLSLIKKVMFILKGYK